jgi:hypothetical protein
VSRRYEDFLPEVIPYVHDCPELVAVNAVRNACLEFCDASMWLLYEQPDILTVAGVGRYELDLPDFTQTARILEAWHNQYPLSPLSEDDLRKLYQFDWREVEGSPRYITSLTPNEVALVPSPTITSAGTLKSIVALRPTRDSIDIDDTIYDRWAEVIGTGARARLMSISNQPFYDPAGSAANRIAFKTGIANAARERLRGFQRSVSRVRPPRVV